MRLKGVEFVVFLNNTPIATEKRIFDFDELLKSGFEYWFTESDDVTVYTLKK